MGARASRAFGCASIAVLVGCGGAPAMVQAPSGPPAQRGAGGGAGVAGNEAEAYEAGAAPADVLERWVRAERSSRLAVALPRGKARERWSVALDPRLDPSFLLSAGTRIVVQGRGTAGEPRFTIVDTKGTKVPNDDPGSTLVRRDADRLEALVASHLGTRVVLQPAAPASVEIEERGKRRVVVEAPVQPLDVSVDDDGTLHALVRQDKDLALWITPLAGGSVGRIRIGPLRRDRASTPPILGKAVRVMVLDDRMLAVAPDGKTLWERKGALTGGATLTADDRLLVASDGKVLVIEPSGRASELVSAPREIFLTPPILSAAGLLLVASGTALHAYAFE